MLNKKFFLIFLILIIALWLPSNIYAQENGNDEISQEQCIYDGGVCVRLVYTVDCNGWEWSYLVISSQPPYYLGVTNFYLYNGTWTNPAELESGQITGTVEVMLIATGESLGEYEFVFEISEPSECLPRSMQLTPKYYMYTLRDSNQPDTWLDYCYVISDEGFPSVERQAAICSVPGFDYTYQATQLIFSGWVSLDANGQPHYGWPAWKHEWYRPEFASQ